MAVAARRAGGGVCITFGATGRARLRRRWVQLVSDDQCAVLGGLLRPPDEHKPLADVAVVLNSSVYSTVRHSTK